MTIKQQIASFHEFALRHADEAGGDENLALDDLYQLWRARTPTAAELHESITALEAAHADLERGETGRPATESLRESCRELELVIDG